MISKNKFPVMGFNSFDGYGWNITEAELKENAIFCDKELKAFGYNYITLDFMWSTPGRDNRANPDQDNAFSPWRNMDRYGRLIPAPDRFPSSVCGMTFKPLADFLHGRSLKFGLHVMCGVPRQAVAAKCIIKGTTITCDEIVDEKAVPCTWNNEMFPIDMEKKGAYDYIRSLIELYTEWEVDLLKVDDLSFPYRKKEVEAYSTAIAEAPREIVFSTSPGATPLSMGTHISKFANMWRISPDFWDDWQALSDQIRLFAQWAPYKSANAFPDGDMFPVSQLSNYGPWEMPRYSNFTHAEKRTFLSIWALYNSPIILGGDLTAIDQKTLSLLQNEWIPALDRFAENTTVKKSTDELLILEATLASRTVVAKVNMSDGVLCLEHEPAVLVNVWGNDERILLPHDTVLYLK